MVVPMLEVALQGEVPTPELRVPLLATVSGGARLGPLELGVQVAAGTVLPEWNDGRGVGWSAIGGLRAAMRFPVGTLALRPLLEVGAEHRLQADDLYRDTPLRRTGLLVQGGADLVLATSPDAWIAGSLVGGWSFLDDHVRLQVGLRVGTAFGRSHLDEPGG